MNFKNFIKICIKVMAFAVIFAVLLSNLNVVLSYGMDRMSYDALRGFYEEEENSLDAVYVGSSNCLAYWNPLLAWEEYGITVYSFASNAQPLGTAQFMIEEARKTQPDAKFVVNINTLSEVDDPLGLYRIYDYTPFSWNKVKSINHTCDLYGFGLSKKLEYYFPVIAFHDRWKNLYPADFDLEPKGFNGSISSDSYLNRTTNISSNYVISNEKAELSPMLDTALNELLDYCDEEKLDITFVTVPQAKGDMIGKYNTINERVANRGYTVLDLMDKAEEVGIDTTKDYYNSKHTNIHGSIKYTHYLSEYLIDTYGFEDKRGNDEYNSWDDALARYMPKIKKAILDIELEADYSGFALDEPEKLTAVAKSEGITLSWETVEGAQGYAVYEKQGAKGKWKKLGETQFLSYFDKNFADKTDYGYRVVAFEEKDGEKVYGDFSYEGVWVTSKTHR